MPRASKQHNGFKAKVMDTSYAEEAGIKSATFQVDAPYAYGRLSVGVGVEKQGCHLADRHGLAICHYLPHSLMMITPIVEVS